MAKYKDQVRNYQENYHYQLLEDLKTENEDLQKKNQLLEEELEKANKFKSKLELDLKEIREHSGKIIEENKALKEEVKLKQEAIERLQGYSSTQGKQSHSVIKGKSIPGKSAERLKETPFINSRIPTSDEVDERDGDWFTRNLSKNKGESPNSKK
ncbi:MAG: hypothetical protein LRY73_18320 [Bacillus sp. (in: Bacteria)]|nr:hypothetical protein [Bacillus sp. (in: firmicutes)]